MNNDLLSIQQVAQIAGVDKTTVYKRLKASSEFMSKIVEERSGSGNRRKRFLPRAVAARFVKRHFGEVVRPPDEVHTREDATELTGSQGDQEGAAENNGNGTGDNAPGVLYIIQLSPHKCESCRNELKIGWTANVAQRLTNFRCGAPFAEILKTWSCKRSWEHIAAECVAKHLTHLRSEVWEGDAETAIRQGDQFFNLMPNA